ncbi:MAG: hypothetical protein ACRDJF_10475 [Actinomycetota bacterium]
MTAAAREGLRYVAGHRVIRAVAVGFFLVRLSAADDIALPFLARPVGAGEAGIGPYLLEILGGGALLVAGGAMMVAAGGMEVVGVGLDATGVGAVVGVPLNVGGGAVFAGRFVVATGGAAFFGHGVGGLIAHMAKGGKQRKRDSGLEGLSDEEVLRRARDPSLPEAERRRYQREEKARGQRNKRKRRGK